MFGLMSTFPVLEEEPPSAPDGTYPDDANQRVGHFSLSYYPLDTHFSQLSYDHRLTVIQ